MSFVSRGVAAFVIATVVASPLAASSPVDEVRDAETAFAKAFADRDQARFFSFVGDDATFLGFGTLNGKKAVVERWSRYFQGSQAPFSWAPERVAVNNSGTIALSTGPVFLSSGEYAGNYTTTWVRQKDGAWKVLFDSSGPSPANLAESSVKSEEGFVTAEDGVKLHYTKVGSGPVTVIVPLGFVLHDDFKQLADIATVITYDPRNRGRSQRMTDVSAMSVQHDVKDLDAVRRHFKAEKFVPIGYSYLGKAVVLYAREYPSHVSRLVQLAPAAMNSATEFPKHLTNGFDDMKVPEADMKRWQQMRAEGLDTKTPREFCEVQWRVFQHLLVGSPDRASRVKVTCDLENEWPVNFDSHLKPLMESLAKTSLTRESLKALTAPVLTIHGTKDRNAPYGAGREWAMSLPEARLLTVENAAHQSWADDPAAVFSAIRAFLRGDWPLSAEKVTRLDRP